jgi:hypothetical protein
MVIPHPSCDEFPRDRVAPKLIALNIVGDAMSFRATVSRRNSSRRASN